MSNKNNFTIVLCNTSSLSEAKTIACKLIEDRLAACVNIIKNECSLYFWEGKIQEECEYQMIIKTKKEFFEKIKENIELSHSYKVPEIISINIADGNSSYLNWIEDSVA